MNQTEQERSTIPDWRVAYCAGYFDGAGSIWVGLQDGKHFYLRINVASADHESLLAFKDLFGGEVMPIRASVPRKSVFHWTRDSMEAIEALSKMLPFLTAKRAEAQLVLDSGWKVAERSKHLSAEQIAKRETLRNALKEVKSKVLEEAKKKSLKPRKFTS